MQSTSTGVLNRAVVVRRPALPTYEEGCLALEDRPLAPLAEGQVLLRSALISIDPIVLTWLRLRDNGYVPPLSVGDTVNGQVIGVVEASRADGFAPGDLVMSFAGWQERSVVTAVGPASFGVTKLHVDPDVPLEAHVSLFSHIGSAALIGLVEIGRAKPGETVVVSGAAGATGSVAAQVAHAYGCRVIGIAGGPEKCAMLSSWGVEAIDYRAEDVGDALRRLCPDGVDVYFDNVGGETLDAVLANLAVGARIAICGAISQYGSDRSEDRYRHRNLFQVMPRRATITGFIVPDYAHRYEAFGLELRRLYDAGLVQARSHVLEGLDAVPQALTMLLEGRNEGKMMVRLDHGHTPG